MRRGSVVLATHLGGVIAFQSVSDNVGSGFKNDGVRMSSDKADRPISVRGTEIVPDDPSRIRLQKLARITLDSMVQFVGLLDADGTVLEINQGRARRRRHHARRRRGQAVLDDVLVAGLRGDQPAL